MRIPATASLTVPLFVAGLSVGLRAQETWDNGPLIGTPFACLVTDGAGPFVEQRLYSKKAGYQSVGARTAAPTLGPDFRFNRIFRDRTTGNVPANLYVDALSLGLDVLWIDSAGVLAPPARSMVGIQFSIRPEAMPTTNGVLRREDSKPDRAGTDVFDFVFGLGSFTSGTFLDMDGTETGLSDGTTTSSATQITALDLPLTAFDLDGGIVGQLMTMTANTPRVFFSVTPASVTAVPAAWWGGPAPPMAKGGAWILYSEWSTTAVDWSEPRPFARPGDLGLDAVGVLEDIDALAVAWDRTGTTKIVFSTQRVAGRNQLLFTELPVDGDPTPVKISGSTTATDGAQAGSADIVAVCFYDPGITGECNNVKIWSYVLGWQSGPPGIFPRLLESSVVRGCDSGGTPGLQCMMAGWSATGRPPTPQVAWGLHVWSVNTSPDAPPAPHTWIFGTPMARPMGRTTGGDPLTSFLALPTHMRVPDITRCDYFWSMWLAAGPGLADLAESRWVRLRL